MSSFKIKPVLSFFLFALLMLSCNTANVLTFAPTPLPSVDPATKYTVKPGDTFGKIAEYYGITVEQLAALNKVKYPQLLRDPSLIKPGMVLDVPNRMISLRTLTAQTAESALRAAILADAAKAIIAQINVARAGKSGLGLLQEEPRLQAIAARRSQDMIDRNYFAHEDPQTGQEPFLRYLQADNYAYRYAGENIAEIKNDAGWVPSALAVGERYTPDELANQFVNGWLGSKDHRANIFNLQYKRTGVALAVTGDGRRVVATQVFSD